MPVALASTVVGQGPPAVVLHGLFGSGTNWRTIARRLGARLECHLVDQRNHGRSQHARGMAYPELARDVLAYLDARGIERAGLIGHSMGGKTAMFLALLAPRRVRWLVVADIAPARSPSNHQPILDALRAIPLAAIATRRAADAALEPAVPEPALRQFLLQIPLVTDGAGFRWRINLDAIAESLPELTEFPATEPGAVYDGPTLFLRGRTLELRGSPPRATDSHTVSRHIRRHSRRRGPLAPRGAAGGRNGANRAIPRRNDVSRRGPQCLIMMVGYAMIRSPPIRHVPHKFESSANQTTVGESSGERDPVAEVSPCRVGHQSRNHPEEAADDPQPTDALPVSSSEANSRPMGSRASDVDPESAYVRFDNVQKSYDGVTLVVKSLNLDIAEGEFVTMLGPSGSGKTTCLMMLAGFEPATHGEIFLNSRPINNVPPHKRGIGMVFQNYALFPHMTVEENLLFPLEVRRTPRDQARQRVAKALEMVELPSFGGRRPAQLSGGQQQRVAVAAPWSSSPPWSSWTSPWARWTSSFASRCSTRSSTFTRTWG